MPPIGTLLVESGAITQKHLDEALQCQVLFGGSIGTNLMELGFVSESALADALARQLGVQAPSPQELENIPDKVIGLIPAPLACDLGAVPFSNQGGILFVAVTDPRDQRVLGDIERASGLKAAPVIVVEARLAYLLEKYYDIKQEHRYVNLIRSLGAASGYDIQGVEQAQEDETSGRFEAVDLKQATEKESPRLKRITRAELDEMLKSAATRDDVAQVVLSFAQNYLRRACLLVVKRDIAYGWAGYGEQVEAGAVRGIMVPLSQPSVFRTVNETRAPYLGPMAGTPINRRFVAAFGGLEPQTVLVAPIAYGNSPIALLYGDNGDGKGVPPKHVAELKILSDMVARSFQRLIEDLRKK